MQSSNCAQHVLLMVLSLLGQDAQRVGIILRAYIAASSCPRILVTFDLGVYVARTKNNLF